MEERKPIPVKDIQSNDAIEHTVSVLDIMSLVNAYNERDEIYRIWNKIIRENFADDPEADKFSCKYYLYSKWKEEGLDPHSFSITITGFIEYLLMEYKNLYYENKELKNKLNGSETKTT